MQSFKKSFRILLFFTVSCLFLNTKAICTDLKLDVVYPKNKAVIDANSTFFVGSTEADATLTINNQPTKVYPNGSFVKVVPLIKGANSICVKSILNGQEKTLFFDLKTPSAPVAMPHLPMTIDESSITPTSDIIYKYGDKLNIRFKGSPGYTASCIINGKIFEIKEQPLSSAGIGGIYEGSYVIAPDDNFKNTDISVRLQSKNAILTKTAKAKITVLPPNSFLLATVSKDKSPVRSTPYGDRLTPLPEKTKLLLDGKFNNHYRFKTNDKNNWIYQDNISIIGETQDSLFAEVKNISVSQENKDVKINVSLSENVPFTVKEQDNSLVFDFFGAKPNLCENFLVCNDFINDISWSAPSNNTFRLFIKIKSDRLWGYDYNYVDNNLVISVRKQPYVDINNPLAGKIIAIDPGHGGNEPGAIGPTGVPEKTVNLAISNYLKNELEKAGATVIMTRTTDEENPDLFARPDIANNNDADILVSIHNNALADGKDPYIEHGTSVYYYNPQAFHLADAIKNNLVKDLLYNNLGALKSSFVLTRPTKPVSVLIEVGFMINPIEYEQLITPEIQQKAAISIKNGIEEYFQNQPICKIKP